MKRSSYAFKLLSSEIKNIEKHLKGVRKGRNEGALHQFRVNARRLRNSLSLFRRMFPKIIMAEWMMELKAVITVTSEARDLDVYINFLKSYAETLLSPVEKNAILGVIDILTTRRAANQKKIVKVLDRLEERRLFPRMTERLEVTIKNYRRKDIDIYPFAKKKILSRVKDVLDYEEFVGKPELKEGLHRLRIKNKHLRYTLEGLRKLYSSSMPAYLETITAFHDLLGEIHDYDVWMLRIDQLLKRSLGKDEQKILSRLKEYCDNVRKRAFQEFAISWHQARQDHFFEELLEYIYSFGDDE